MTAIPPHFRRCVLAAVLALVGWQIYVARRDGDGTPSQGVDSAAVDRASPPGRNPGR